MGTSLETHNAKPLIPFRGRWLREKQYWKTVPTWHEFQTMNTRKPCILFSVHGFCLCNSVIRWFNNRMYFELWKGCGLDPKYQSLPYRPALGFSERLVTGWDSVDSS